jgi:hypothetical protein
MSSALGDSNPYAPPASEIGTAVPADPAAGGMPFGGFLVLYFFGSLCFMWIFWGLFWSGWMALMMGWDFLTTLIFRGLPGGFFVGFLTSALITAYLGLFMRRRTVAIAFTGDRAEFIAGVIKEVGKRRYRLTHQSASALAFAAGGLFHYGYFDLIVNVGDAQAAVSGPRAIISVLGKKLKRD